MSKVTYNDQSFDMEELRAKMDKDILAELEVDSEVDQDFLDSYLIAHEKKHGERFSIG